MDFCVYYVSVCSLTVMFQAGHLKMLDGYIDFFMDPSLSECYLQLKEELDKLIQQKVSHAVNWVHFSKGFSRMLLCISIFLLTITNI